MAARSASRFSFTDGGTDGGWEVVMVMGGVERLPQGSTVGGEERAAYSGWMDRAALHELTERVKELPERVRVVSRVAKQSGMLWDMTWKGLRVAAKVVGGAANNPSQVYRILAANHPERVGVYWHDEALTFAEIDARMDRVAAGLQRRGLGRGSSLLVMMKNRPEFCLSGGGASRLGAAAVSVSWRSTAQELAYLAAHCGATAIGFE